MRLFYFVEFDIGSDEGGCTAHAEGLTRGLHKLGWEITLFSGAESETVRQPKYPFRNVLTKVQPGNLIQLLLTQFRLGYKLLRFKDVGPDVIYVRSSFALFAPMLYARLKKIPYFYEINGIKAQETGRVTLTKIAEKVENWFLKGATGIFCVTSELKEYFMKRAGLPEDKFTVIHNGVDADIWPPPDDITTYKKKDCFYIGYLGHFARRQGVETVIRALPKIRQEIGDVRLIVGGSGPEEEHYKKIPEEVGVSAFVEFPGFVPRHRLSSFLSQCDIVVAPYTLDFAKGSTGLSPIKMYTYLACERIIVASDLHGLCDFRGCPAVRFAAPDDPDDFSRAIVEILKMSSADRKRLGREGREFILAGYTWDHVAKQTSDCILNWFNQR
jgi:glycosyltransferase involved in cell wall biosynthesis